MPPRRRRIRSGAFTLVEMITVIAIILLLMGIAIGAIFRTPRVNALIASEQMLTDAVRQARHTARTSGAPVVLRLEQGKRQISGMVRQPLWQGAGNWPLVPLPGSTDPPPPMPGRTGDGLLVPDGYTLTGIPTKDEVVNALAPRPGAIRDQTLGWTLRGVDRLARGGLGPPPAGLWLSAWVCPPVAGAQVPLAGADQPARTILPVVLVGSDASAAGFATIDDSLIGLALRRIDPDSSAGARALDCPMPDGRPGPAMPIWEIIGWIRDADPSIGRVEVSSVHKDDKISDPRMPELTPIEQERLLVRPAGGGSTGQKVADVAAPFIGGSWTQLALLYADGILTLYQDGRRIAQVRQAVTLAATGGDERVVVGWLASSPIDPDGSAAMALAVGSPVAADNARIDDIRIERLGSLIAGNLPGAMRPATPATITCHPDGRVEVSPDAPIELRDADDAAAVEQRALFTIDALGTISQLQLQAESPAPEVVP